MTDREKIAQWLAMRFVYGRDNEFNPLNYYGLSQNEKEDVNRDANRLLAILEPTRREVAREIFELVQESLNPFDMINDRRYFGFEAATITIRQAIKAKYLEEGE